jgi:PAS domain S-box-containing protein
MDIILKKEMDGIEAAEIIIKNFNIPVIYLTAHSDEATINKAKITEPYGYLLKPFNERDLLTNIEIALYKHKMETKLRMSEKWFSTTLKSIGDAIIATDNLGNIKFMNGIAERITGWTLEQCNGKSLNHVFNIINEKTLEKIENPVEKVLRDGSLVSLENHTALICKNGNKVPIEDSAAPIKSDNGDIQGVVMVFHDLTEKKKLQEQLIKRQKL